MIAFKIFIFIFHLSRHCSLTKKEFPKKHKSSQYFVPQGQIQGSEG